MAESFDQAPYIQAGLKYRFRSCAFFGAHYDGNGPDDRFKDAKKTSHMLLSHYTWDMTPKSKSILHITNFQKPRLGGGISDLNSINYLFLVGLDLFQG